MSPVGGQMSFPLARKTAAVLAAALLGMGDLAAIVARTPRSLTEGIVLTSITETPRRLPLFPV
jgi:hypothetical protein